ncbi:S1C family serine protease [Piscinibacter terrae]|uniref:PDZ domain-containing protein n=1 Tax=Piscinibacter terrae TaxID=2496871 RepID=A0A3N7IWB6_9BURK|nr:trypsin-like peptidase domain-containing protein [Albitalea terrae]RQP23062.1 PDZ domain-containing protein [Albitalea terrae]
MRLSTVLFVALFALSPSLQARPAAPPRAITPRGPLAAEELNNIAVFKASSPSVVNITALGLERDFFSLDVQQVPQGTGTGFVWDVQGHVVTNFHVIQGASGARVTLADQSSYKAELVGAFPDRDIAVLKIAAPAAKLRALPVGSSRDLQVGQKVYAIGNPFGLDQTLTTGIVSALNREIESVTRRTIKGGIQTDAAINPGNSGGPLLDSAGRLIGVNTAIFSPSGASAGIGFAIPVDEVNRIVPRLIRDGRMVRPSLGVTGGGAEINRALGLPKGVALLRVQRNGPAARAGLKPFTRGDNGIVQGDVITAVDDEAVETMDDMLTVLERLEPGNPCTLTIWRAGATRKQTVTLAESED